MNMFVALVLSHANAVPLSKYEAIGTARNEGTGIETAAESFSSEPISNQNIVNYNGIVVLSEAKLPETEHSEKISISYNVTMDLGNKTNLVDLLSGNNTESAFESLGFNYHSATGTITKLEKGPANPQDESRETEVLNDFDRFDETGIVLHDRSSFKTNSCLIVISLFYILFLI